MILRATPDQFAARELVQELLGVAGRWVQDHYNPANVLGYFQGDSPLAKRRVIVFTSGECVANFPIPSFWPDGTGDWNSSW